MRADGIFDLIVGLVGWEHSDKTEYESRFIHTLNLILAECFYKNNALRRARDIDEMEEMPHITAITDEVGFEPEFERDIIPLGVAGYMFVDDDETGISNIYREEYRRKLEDVPNAQAGRARFEEAEREW